MKYRLITLSLAVAAVIIPILSDAATPTTLTVTGTINPSPCTITATGSTTIDLNNISWDKIEADKELTELTVPGGGVIQVSCDAPTFFGISAHDERHESLPSSSVTERGGLAWTDIFGLSFIEKKVTLPAASIYSISQT